jgi:hypothetical protein
MKIFHHSVLLFVWSLWIIWWLFFQDKSYTNYIEKLTSVNVQIFNSYSWSVSRATGQNIIYSWGAYWTNQNNLTVIVSATTGSNFILSGSISTLTGQWTGAYQLARNIILYNWDGAKSLQALFIRWHEPYDSNVLNIMLDTTAPSLPIVSWPITNSLLTWVLPFARTASSDSGIGFSHYNIHISLDPWFLGKVVIPISWNSIDILSSDLPQWTLFWYIEAVDLLWNSTQTSPQFFHNWRSSAISWWWWWGYTWWWTWENNSYKLDDSNSHTTGNKIYTWENTSWDSIEDITWKDIDTNINNKDNNSLKDILIWKFNVIPPQEKWTIVLPNPDIITITHPSADLYRNLLWLYYHHLNPLWYTMNLISRLLIPFYYLAQWLQHYLIRNKKNRI